MRSLTRRLIGVSAAAVTIVGLTACGGGSSKGGGGGGATPSASASTPAVSVSSFTSDFSVMAQLSGLAAAGKGKVAVLLPETTTSARYVSFDAPYLTQAFQKAGLSSSQFSVTNAQGNTATQLTQAQSAITEGASVLLVDPIDSGVGASIEKLAKSSGVKVIDYDRITLGGTRDYYVSFDNVKVGELIGKGFVDCVAAWKVPKPQVLVMKGAPTDNNATLFAQGYLSVLKPHFDSGEYVKVAEPTGTWDPPTAQTTFQQQYTAHKNINSVVMPNDANANAVIASLKTLQIKPKTFPVTGQDAQLSAMQNILAGYQCGTVYKPIYLEAQAAAALALYLRAGQTPPASLVNGKTNDSQAKVDVPSSLLTPLWVTTENMASTVVKDEFVKASEICTGSYAALCTQAGIKP